MGNGPNSDKAKRHRFPGPAIAHAKKEKKNSKNAWQILSSSGHTHRHSYFMNMIKNRSLIRNLTIMAGLLCLANSGFASEADIHIPPLDAVRFGRLVGVSGAML